MTSPASREMSCKQTRDIRQSIKTKAGGNIKMDTPFRPYAELLFKMKKHFTTNQNAEMVAMIVAAEYQYQTLFKICNTKMTQVCPSVASEAITTVDEIAEKLLKKVGLDNEQASQENRTV